MAPDPRPEDLPAHLRARQAELAAARKKQEEQKLSRPPIQVKIPALRLLLLTGPLLMAAIPATFLGLKIPVNIDGDPIALAAPGFIVGFFMILFGYSRLKAGLVEFVLDRRRTREVTGLLTACELEQKPGRSGGWLYRVLIRFSYEANGATWEKDYRPTASFHNIMSRIEAVQNEFPAGKVVTVRFDPETPLNASFIPGPPGRPLVSGLFFILGWVLWGFAILLAWLQFAG